ncbi:MAG TPA: YceH family protein [Pyrinomonadaceae bacterium]|nr:YceH family protein [Pyrinomonadaceae bacterium]
METVLNDAEVRVLGSLVEKQLTTPEYYPLTLNALTNACNQISNRDPVVSYDEETVVRALDGLRAKGFAHVVYASNSRVPKYKHTMMDALAFTQQQELAVMCVLLLRGPQTLGEIRGRTERLYSFRGLPELEATLEALMSREQGALVTRLPRLTGQKEARYAHLLAGEVKVDERETERRPVEPATAVVRASDERVARLEEEVAALRGELAELRQQFGEFKKQFE